MQMLKAKLYLLKEQENAEKAAGIRGEVTEIGWGNQIRSYVMQPYTMVKDHRTRCGNRKCGQRNGWKNRFIYQRILKVVIFGMSRRD